LGVQGIVAEQRLQLRGYLLLVDRRHTRRLWAEKRLAQFANGGQTCDRLRCLVAILGSGDA